MITNVITITTKNYCPLIAVRQVECAESGNLGNQYQIITTCSYPLHKLQSPRRIRQLQHFRGLYKWDAPPAPLPAKRSQFEEPPNFWLNHIWISSNFASASVSVQVSPSLKLHKHLHAGGPLPAAVGCSQLWLRKRTMAKRGSGICGQGAKSNLPRPAASCHEHATKFVQNPTSQNLVTWPTQNKWVVAWQLWVKKRSCRAVR